MSSRRIAVGSRGSALALAQAALVTAALERDGRATRLVIVETAGDRRAPDTAWGEGAFVTAIELALIDGRIDVAVHSAKDVPIEQDARLRIAAYLPRADPRDAVVVRAGAVQRRLADLPPGSRVGTDSPRRTGFVRAHRPDLVVHPLHGNVDTRLRRLDDGETDALILACAGLDRLGLGDRIAERLEPDLVPPAPGQGAIAVQIRHDDARMLAFAAVIDDQATRIAVEMERAFLEASGGGCRAPIGALATLVGDSVELLAGRVDPDGSSSRLGHRRGPIAAGPGLTADLAAELALDAGAGRVLVTRAAAQAEPLVAALRAAGLAPVLVPTIATELDPDPAPLARAVRQLGATRWAVVTSANGARAAIAAADRAHAALGSTAWAAIGAATGSILEQAGVAIGFVPSRRSAESMAAELPAEPGDRVLVVRGDLAGDGLATALRARGAVVDDVVAYRTVEGPPSSRSLLERAVAGGSLAAVVFTSGSTVRGLLSIADAGALEVRSIPAVCIGPETAVAARSAGFRVLAVSAGQDPSALARATADALAGDDTHPPVVAASAHARQPQEIA